MSYGIYEDLSRRYAKLVMLDVYTLTKDLNIEEAHKSQYLFRFKLFCKNADSFNELFTQTSTVEDPGKYNNFRNALNQFMVVIKRTIQKSKINQNDLDLVHEIEDLLRDSYDALDF